jgi:hypothetical protein
VTTRLRNLLSAALALSIVACRPSTDLIAPSSSRPTSVDGIVYRAYGNVVIQMHRTSDGCCTIWYAEEGEHALASSDSGLPGRVVLVEQAAAEVFALLNATGWRPPVPDPILPPVTDFGDSKNLDIYLLNFVRGDGMWVEEHCTSGRRSVCTGFLAMHNAQSAGYTSEEEGVQVLVSHEIFHAVQAAYASDLPRWFSEGTATLFEETLYPAQSDFERLGAHFFEHPGRSLNAADGGLDGFSYSNALFFHFLSQEVSDDYVRDVLERIARGQTPEQAMVRQAGGIAAFADLFSQFSLQTWLTGERAVGFAAEDRLPGAADYPAMPLADFVPDQTLTVAPWASTAVRIAGQVLSQTLTLQADGQGASSARLVIAPANSSSAPPPHGPVRIGDALELPAGAEFLVVVSNADSAAPLTATLRLVPADK